jgi:hypothetical protein
MKCVICDHEINQFLEDHGIKHVCPPAFSIRRGDGYSDSWDTIYSDDIEYDIDRYCDAHFSDWEYPESGFTIQVKPLGSDGPITIYEVEVEHIPSFFVSEKATFQNEDELEKSE